METKLFKIGECAIGGIIKVDISGKRIDIKCLQYVSKKEVGGQWSKSFEADGSDSKFKLLMFLGDASTSYHADKIIEWVESKVTLNKGNRW